MPYFKYHFPQGRCFGLFNSSLVGSRTIEMAANFNNNQTYLMYFHNPGEELWLWSMVLPLDINFVKIPSKKLAGMKLGFDVHIKKKRKEILNRFYTSIKLYSV